MKPKKFVIYGPYTAGKTTFLLSLLEETDDRFYGPPSMSSDGEPGSMEFGRMVIENTQCYFYSVATHKRFDFIWEILTGGASGYLFIVDSTRTETFMELRRAIPIILGFRYAPYIVIANKQDHPDAYPIALMHRALDLDESVPIVPCAADDKASAQAAFNVLLMRMRQKQPPHNMKFLICGPCNAGKTIFTKRLVDEFSPQIVHRGRKRQDDIIADFGTIRVDDNIHSLHAVSTEGQFDYVCSSLAPYCNGFIFIVDSAAPETFGEFGSAMRNLLTQHPWPSLIIANKQDQPNAFTPEAIRQALDIDASVSVAQCVGYNRSSVKAAFEVLLKQIAEISG